ncbi:hypothetical protein ACH4UM_23735 [Streptomyces sp. NPDC020801]|uniref:hypothetical protein n=1 Tax=Streptomyces sp. NPDC020801 TaxID=3365093 RepID=UPI00378C160A
MSKTMSTPAELPAPTANHLSSLAAALRPGDDVPVGRVFDEIAAETLALAQELFDEVRKPGASRATREIYDFVGMLHEFSYGAARALLDPPKPKRRWFR